MDKLGIGPSHVCPGLAAGERRVGAENSNFTMVKTVDLLTDYSILFNNGTSIIQYSLFNGKPII